MIPGTYRRKIIQIIDCPDTERCEGCITALCNDGSIWFYQHKNWTLLDCPIPQDPLPAGDSSEKTTVNYLQPLADKLCGRTS